MQPTERSTLSTVRLLAAYVLGLAGAGSSVATIYATPAEGLPKLGCALQALDCSVALTSQFSKVAGIPLGVFGLFYFIFWLLNLRAYHRSSEPIYQLVFSYVTSLGAIASASLAVIMFFVLKAPCLYCMITHGANIGSLLLLWPFLSFRKGGAWKADPLWHFAALAAIALLSAVALSLASENRNLQAKLKDATKQKTETLF